MKKFLQQHRVALFLIKALVLYLGFCTQAIAQQIVQGKVTDDNSQPLFGVSIAVKGTNKGAYTDADGKYSIEAKSSATLVFTYVGFKSKQVVITNQTNVNVVLQEDTQALDEVIVTGVSDARTKMESSIAISSLSAKDMSKMVPASAADLLKNVPGVYVNSALGEIRNVVYSRGVSANSSDGDRGYYYVSMQEDGLPVTNVTYGNYGPDYFLRLDANILKVEAVRGGSASIFGPNAPGGIFNYISKTGKPGFQGEAKVKLGLQGDNNPYYRTDLNVGGSINNSISYNIGGFYRYDNGSRNPGYAMNNGGQVKGNIIKTYDKGFLKVYAKYLNDHNGWFEFSPARNFSNPQLAEGVSITDAYLPSKKIKFDYQNNDGTMDTYDPTRLAHSIDFAAGMEWSHRFGEGWKFNNNFKYTAKTSNWNSGAGISPVDISGIFPYFFSNTLGKAGTYQYTDLVTGQPVATVTSSDGFSHTVTANSLPGQNVQSNGVMFQGLLVNNNKVNEIIDQFSLSKKIDNMSFTLGGYFAKSNVNVDTGFAGVSFGTIENRPHPIGITLTTSSGDVMDVTNSVGAAGMGRASFNTSNIDQTQMALFFGHNWQISEKLNFDWGVRFDNVGAKGENYFSTNGVDNGTGGLDGNVNTIYDNYATSDRPKRNFDKNVSIFSYTGALNYSISDNYAIYTRFSVGKKAPDLILYTTAITDFTIDNLDPRAQDLKQVEIGFKTKLDQIQITVTPFYSLLSNIPTAVSAQNEDGTAYFTPNIFNEQQTYGLELETKYSIEKFGIRGVFTLQKGEARAWKVWMLGANGSSDDTTLDFSGNKLDNNPNIMFNISPDYQITNKINVYGNWSFMGERPANVANTFTLPSFSQFDLGLNFKATDKLDFNFNVVNAFQGTGVMGWLAPGGFPASLDRQGFTPAQLAANPNASFSILTIQPRSMYLTATYKF
ncbi:outer membrane receptor protein involved in Fe transport [Flavobacteriaceae bacterium MAR_2010_72]|nr:outer membrane receptor protein involved in Fe transport [Flavobacteriaceae bacterium MAR_2010_72]